MTCTPLRYKQGSRLTIKAENTKLTPFLGCWLPFSLILLLTTAAHALILSSDSFQPYGLLHAAQVYNGMGCSGQNRSPQLFWSNEPAGTRSFAITMYDPDAPTGHGWWHWLVFNIPRQIHDLPEGWNRTATAYPSSLGTSFYNDFDQPDYGGPCPPAGDNAHHYLITVYALKTATCPLPRHSAFSLITQWLERNQLDHAQITGRYGR